MVLAPSRSPNVCLFPHASPQLCGADGLLPHSLLPRLLWVKKKKKKIQKKYYIPHPRTINLLIKYFLRCFKFWNFSLLCLVLHSFSAIQNQPLLTYTKYVWFWGCKGHTTVWPYTLQLIQKLPGYSMMTLDLDKLNVCNLHFCLPHPIISFLWNSQCFVNESTKHEFLEIKLCCFWIWFPLKLKPTSPLLGSGKGIIVLLPFFGRKNGRRTDPPYSMHLAMHGEGVQHFFNIL